MNRFTREQRVLLIVLALINFFNYLDRQIVFPLFDSLKLEFGVNDFQLGLLGTVFMLVFSIMSLPLGFLADKYSRKAMIAGGAVFWSIVTFASGLVTNFASLLTTRALVGIGEASYAPAATALISDNFPQNVRSQAQGIFSTGMFAGGTLGAILGGLVIYYLGNWRYAFFIVAIPGFVLAWLASRIHDAKATRTHESISLASMIDLFRNPGYSLIVSAGTLLTFTAGAYISWGVAFVSRYKGLNLRDTSVFMGLNMMVAGLLGVILGSYLADKMHMRMRAGRSLLIGVALLLAMPFMFLGLSESSHYLFFVYFFIGMMFMSFHHGPSIALLHDVVPPHMRATASAVYILVVHLLGDTFSPAAVGYISDKYSLLVGLQTSTWLVGISGFIFLIIGWVIHKRIAKTYEDHEDIILI